MNVRSAKKIILYVAEKTKQRWKQYDEHWGKINEVFIRRGYEQGGFEAWKFTNLLKEQDIFSIDKIGRILDTYKGNISYSRNFAGGPKNSFYKEMKTGLYGKEGIKFYFCVEDFKGKPGAWFWKKLWQMLVCCNYLRNNYKGSFAHFLKKKYAKFKHLNHISDSDFLSIDPEDWEQFKITKPWKELYGIGENVFDFILGDIVEAKFAKDSYKLDSANLYFLKVTGISKLLNNLDRENVVNFLRQLNLQYALREINKGIYTYCSETEAKNFGFCRNRIKCSKCKVSDVCEKNF